MSVKKELFISYGREPEVTSFVVQLKHDLEQNGFTVWLDAEDIPAGSDWHGAIGTGLHECKALIAVITNRYISSRYCTGELYTADADQRLIFPVIFENVDFGSSEKARGVKYVIGGINWTMFRPGFDDYHTSLGKLIQGMKEQGLGCIPGTDATDYGDVNAQMAQLHLSPPSGQTPQPHGRNSPIPFHPHQTPPWSPGVPFHQGMPTFHPHQSPPGYAPPSPYGFQPYSPQQTLPQMQQHGIYPPNISPSGQPYYYPPTNMAPPFMPQTNMAPPYMPPTPPRASQQPHPPDYSELYPESGAPPFATETTSLPQFKVGMKLEAVDRRFPYFVCVATIMDRSADGKVRVHFDGWDLNYDYWCPPDAIELHPVGWCQKHNWEIQSPLNQAWRSWEDYLKQTDATPADASLFTADQLAGVGSLLFRANMRLEAKDRQDPTLFRVATIADIKDDQLLIHFDGWGPRYDYWCKPDSTDIHPAHWCGKNGRRSDLQPPKGHVGTFKWSEYFSESSIIPVPAHIFTEEQTNPERAPTVNLNGFETNMKLEAKDRLNPSLVAVATIADIKDGQLLIHFDGWGPRYDYWCKPDSTDIHPKGWYGQDLQPPQGSSGFNWNSYLQQCSAVAAPRGLFTEAQKSGGNDSFKSQKAGGNDSFKVGMKLEAKDRLYPTLTCVSTIKEIRDGQLLIHFDGWDNKYDYWCDPDSTDIHPKGWCRRHSKRLQPPKGSSGFNWQFYLQQCSALAAPDGLFIEAQKARGNDSFKVGMKLEAKDRLYPTLTCVSTIKEIRDGQLLIHFDGWDSKYDYWCDPDSTDIHPRGWCKRHGKKLQPPKGSSDFNWQSYLQQCSALAAPDGLFRESQKSGGNDSFKVGMKLEAKDRLYPTLTCVSTIKEIRDGQLLIHFDGWDSKYDYWCDPDSTDIHPRGWCRNHDQALQPPQGMSGFNWDSYLQQQNAVAAPRAIFTEAQREK